MPQLSDEELSAEESLSIDDDACGEELSQSIEDDEELSTEELLSDNDDNLDESESNDEDHSDIDSPQQVTEQSNNGSDLYPSSSMM